MASDSIETIEAFYEVNRDAVDDAIEMLDPDLVADFSRSIKADIKGVYHGREEVRVWLGSFLEAWEELEWFVDEYIEEGEDVIRVGGIRARGRGSGVEVVAKGAQLWEFRDGTATAMRQFQSKANAVEHLGM